MWRDWSSPHGGTRKEMRTLAIGQMTTQLLPTLKGHRLYAAFVMVFMLGLRRDEILGLRWQDVDWPAAVLSIRQTSARVKNHETGHTHLVFQDPKTERSRRALPLPEGCLAALRQHRAHQAEERLALGQAYADHGLVFCHADGRPIDPRTLNRSFS